MCAWYRARAIAARPRARPRGRNPARRCPVSCLDAARGHHGAGGGDPGRKRPAIDLGRARRRAERRGRDPVVRRQRLPRQHRRRGQGLRPVEGDAGEGGAPHLERRALRRRRGARGGRRRRARHRQSLADRRRDRKRDGRPPLHAPAAADPRGARLGPRVAALAPEHAGRHLDQPRRNAARSPRHQLLDRVRLRDRHPCRSARRPRRSPATRPTSCWRAPPSRRWCRSSSRASARCERSSTGGTTRRGLAAVRRHPRRLRDGRGRRGPRPRGARAGPGARRADLRRDRRLRRVERRVPHRDAASGVDRRRSR